MIGKYDKWCRTVRDFPVLFLSPAPTAKECLSFIKTWNAVISSPSFV